MEVRSIRNAFFYIFIRNFILEISIIVYNLNIAIR